MKKKGLQPLFLIFILTFVLVACDTSNSSSNSVESSTKSNVDNISEVKDEDSDKTKDDNNENDDVCSEAEDTELTVFDVAVANETTAALKNASAGDIITFGSYEQDNDLNNGTEPIEWYVLEKGDSEATLLAVYILDIQPYHTGNGSVTWETCSLRSWLNENFYNNAFNDDEKATVIKTHLINEDNPYFGTEWGSSGGNDTEDKVWLLSLGEVEKYFGVTVSMWADDWEAENRTWIDYGLKCYNTDNKLTAYTTPYAEILDVYAEHVDCETYPQFTYTIGASWWLLRSPGDTSSSATEVRLTGAVQYSDGSVNAEKGIRPAIKVKY